MKKTLSIVLICGLLITMGGVSVFADTITSDGMSYSSVSLSPYGILQCYISSSNPYISEFNPFHNELASADQNLGYTTVAQDYTFNIRISNDTSNSIELNTGYIRIRPTLATPTPATNDSIMQVSYIVGNITGYSDVIVTYNNGDIDILPNYAKGFVIPPNSRLMINFNITRYTNVFSLNKTGASVQSLDAKVTSNTISAPTSASINNNATYYNVDINSYYARNLLIHLDSNVQSILDQYTANAQNAQAVTNGTQNNEQTLSTIGTNEDTWFTQNDQALQATGISNFNYTPTVMSGMSVISDQFTQLWLAIGDWNFVYTFSMMLGLVVLILRHNPQRKKSSSSSSGGGKSNAASS